MPNRKIVILRKVSHYKNSLPVQFPNDPLPFSRDRINAAPETVLWSHVFHVEAQDGLQGGEGVWDDAVGLKDLGGGTVLVPVLMLRYVY